LGGGEASSTPALIKAGKSRTLDKKADFKSACALLTSQCF
jgi:hypothetical protein